jgi:GMP synthase PP-ATPase subunit
VAGAGLIYPDVIGSAVLRRRSRTVKSHHNVDGLPDTLHETAGAIARTLQDEVREPGWR